MAATRTPFFTFRDLDENSPEGSVNMRVETIDYFLQWERRRLLTGTDDDCPQDRNRAPARGESAAVTLLELDPDFFRLPVDGGAAVRCGGQR